MSERKKKILVLDDSFEIHLIYAFVLAKAYELECTTSPKDALEKTIKNEYDLLLVDLNLAESETLEGLGFIDNVRKSYPKEALPILIVTTHYSPSIATEAGNKGANDFISKADYKPKLLLEKIEKLLKEKEDLNSTIEVKVFVSELDLSTNRYKEFKELFNSESLLSRNIKYWESTSQEEGSSSSGDLYQVELGRADFVIFLLSKHFFEDNKCKKAFYYFFDFHGDYNINSAMIQLDESDVIKQSKINFPEKPIKELSTLKETLLKELSLSKSLEEYERLWEENTVDSWENVGLLNKLRELSSSKGMTERAHSYEKASYAMSRRLLFQANVQRWLRLDQVSVQSVKFFDRIDWNVQPRFNILLGKNGYGKSFLLKLILALLTRNEDALSDFFDSTSPETKTTGASAKIDLLSNTSRNSSTKTTSSGEKPTERIIIDRKGTIFKDDIGKIPVLGIGDLRYTQRADNSLRSLGETWEIDIVENGAIFFLKELPEEDRIRAFYAKFSESWNRFKNEHPDLDVMDFPLAKLLNAVISDLSDDDNFSIQSPIIDANSGNYLLNINTANYPDQSNPVSIIKASRGMTSVLGTLVLIYSYLENLAELRKDKERPVNEQHAVVLIDELDAHLHPSWQQKIVGLLTGHFPNVQFIVSAHSPLIVAGCKENEAVVLRKQNGRFTLENITRHFIGASSEELYNAIFDVEDKDQTYETYEKFYALKEKYIDKKIQERQSALSRVISDAERKKIKQVEEYYFSEFKRIREHRENEDSLFEINEMLRREIKRLKRKIDLANQ